MTEIEPVFSSESEKILDDNLRLLVTKASSTTPAPLRAEQVDQIFILAGQKKREIFWVTGFFTLISGLALAAITVVIPSGSAQSTPQQAAGMILGLNFIAAPLGAMVIAGKTLWKKAPGRKPVTGLNRMGNLER